jgi:translocation and assembly module TamA
VTRGLEKPAGAAAAALLAFVLPFRAEARETVKVEVHGLGGALGGLLENYSLKGSDVRQNVLSVLSIEDHRKDENLTEARIRGLHGKAPAEIRKALEPFGYFRPTIDAELTHESGEWRAVYRVDPGPPLRVGTADVTLTGPGENDPALAAAARAFPLRSGDVAVSPAYERGKEAIETAAAENGYLDAAFEESEIRVDLERYTADVVLRYETGPRYLFGPVRFEQHILDEKVIRGYVTWTEGEPISTKKLLELQNGLSSAPYFRRVEVVPRKDEAADLRVPIEVSLTPAKPFRFEVGAGYGTDTGPRGTFNTLLRRVNAHGDHADLKLTASGIEQSGILRYLVPGPYPRTDVYTFSVGYQHLNPETSTTKVFLTGVDRSQMRAKWRESFSLFYRREDYVVGVDRGTSNLLIPGAHWEKVVADDRIDARRGWRVSFLVQAAVKGVISDATFLRPDVTAKMIRSIGKANRVIGRAEVGYTATSDLRRLPPEYRFFAGGDQSIRGYGYRDVGPLDEEGNVVGGKILAVGSLELEHRFLPKWGVAVFVDGGNAMNALSEGWKTGAGAGVRWVSPVGPIRVDGAYGFDEPSKGWKLHVNIGPDL